MNADVKHFDGISFGTFTSRKFSRRFVLTLDKEELWKGLDNNLILMVLYRYVTLLLQYREALDLTSLLRTVTRRRGARVEASAANVLNIVRIVRLLYIFLLNSFGRKIQPVDVHISVQRVISHVRIIVERFPISNGSVLANHQPRNKYVGPVHQSRCQNN